MVSLPSVADDCYVMLASAIVVIVEVSATMVHLATKFSSAVTSHFHILLILGVK